MADFVQHPVVQALAWALVHFVWQGTVIGLAAFVALRATRPAAARYAIGVGALALMLAAPVATFLLLTNSPSASASHQALPMSPVPAPAPTQPTSHDPGGDAATVASASGSLRVSPETLAIAVISWFAGVAFFSVRLLGGWLVARGVARRTVQPAADRIQHLGRELAGRLSVRRPVRILESAAVAVPVMVGWLKPAIVLPVAALASLTPSQLEALLAHELAHVRRHDYLVNVLQSVAEAVLFYHPAVWWLSRQVRAERELCCDDLAVGVCDRLVYATALTDLAMLTTPRIALAATDGNLLARVRRILGQGEEPATVRAGLMPVVALALVAAVVAVPAALASGTAAAAEPPTPQDQKSALRLIGQVSASVGQTGVAIAAERAGTDVAVAELQQQSSDQADRQRQIEEVRRKIEELQKQLAQLEQRRVGEVVDAQRQQEIQKLVEAQRRAAVARQDEVKKLIDKMSQSGMGGEEQQRAMEAMLKDLAKMQADVHVQSVQSESVRRAFEDAQRQFERGQISEQQLKEVEAALKRAEAAFPQAIASADMARIQDQLARAKVLSDKGLMSEAQVAEIERAMKMMQSSGDELAKQALDLEEARAKLNRATELAQKGLTAQRDVEQARRDVQLQEQRLAERRTEVAPESPRPSASRSARMEPAADQHQTVKRGDILRVTIQGEPDLPTTYEVTAEGTIRLPFIGSTKAVGLTPADIRTAIGKQLADRKLGSTDRVTVTLMGRR